MVEKKFYSCFRLEIMLRLGLKGVKCRSGTVTLN